MLRRILTVLVFLSASSDTSWGQIVGSPLGDPDTVVEQYLAKAQTGSKRDRTIATARLEQELSLNYNQRQRRRILGQEKRTRLITKLMAEYRELEGTDSDSEELRKALAELITAHGNSPEAKQFVFETIEEDSPGVRDSILSRLGSPDGVSGDDLYAKVDEWTQKGIIQKNDRPGFLARFGKTRAIPEILKIVDSTQDRDEFFYAAWALQDAGASNELARVFRRVEEMRMTQKFHDGPNALHWVNTQKLEKYVSAAQGEDLLVILRLLPDIPTIRSETLLPMIIQKLRDTDPRIRKEVAKRLADFSKNPRIDYEATLSALKSAIKSERDAVVLNQFSASLNKVQTRREWAQRFLQREKEWKKKNEQ